MEPMHRGRRRRGEGADKRADRKTAKRQKLKERENKTRYRQTEKERQNGGGAGDKEGKT